MIFKYASLLPRVFNLWATWLQLSAEQKAEAESFKHTSHEIRCANLAVAELFIKNMSLRAQRGQPTNGSSLIP